MDEEWKRQRKQNAIFFTRLCASQPITTSSLHVSGHLAERSVTQAFSHGGKKRTNRATTRGKESACGTKANSSLCILFRDYDSFSWKERENAEAAEPVLQ